MPTFNVIKAMDPNNRKQEYLVGVYRNVLQEEPWIHDVTEAAQKLGPRVVMLDQTKLRVHLMSMGELDNANVIDSEEAEMVAKHVSEKIFPSFHSELDVLFGGLSLLWIADSDKRSIVLPVVPRMQMYEERSTVIGLIPWTGKHQTPRPSSFDYGLRIGTVYEPDIKEQTVQERLKAALPKGVTLQKGKIKTL